MKTSVTGMLILVAAALLSPAAADADFGPACIWQVGPAGNSQTEVMFRATDTPTYFMIYGLRKQFNNQLSSNLVTGGAYVQNSQVAIGWEVFPNPGTAIAEKAGGVILFGTGTGNGQGFHLVGANSIPFSFTWTAMGGACGPPYPQDTGE